MKFHVMFREFEKNKFPYFIWRDRDRWFIFLWGIDTEGEIKPLYLPLLRVWRSTGMLYIEFPKLRILLMQRKPYLYIERASKLAPREEE